jgi:iron complex outermembrane receptor protein
MLRRITLFLFLFFLYVSSSVAQQLNGSVRDEKTNEPVIGATIVLKGTTVGSTTDTDGKFELKINVPLPFLIVVSFVGYDSQELKITSLDQPLKIKLKSKQVELTGVEIAGSRISEKEKEAPLTVESMDRIAIKECAQTTFYEALGTLKGVDLTSASLGFTVINTRGFNSTSPVRSLQIIDGVDNQSPGLNFSLGNFLGSSELDVLKVDLISGASSAYYGPNAFNGVISINTRSPFIKPGLEVSVKAGERNLWETAVRWSQVFKNKAGEDKFGYKLNLFYMQANDWEANNLAATPQSKSDEQNPGRYDAVNRYGDEYNVLNDASIIATIRPGLGIWYRTGYLEKDLVDYDTRNLKLGAAFHYKVKKETELILASNFGTGTTVYQGDNRYSLKDILFFQNRIELRKENKFFIRAYATNEDAGNSYDSYFTAIKLQQSAKSDDKWAQDYNNYWNIHYSNKIRNFPGYPQYDPALYPSYTDYINSINPWLLAHYPDSMYLFHSTTQNYADNHVNNAGQSPFFVPGTAAFDSAFHSVTTTLFTEGGSRFYDKSALYHVQGEYKFTPTWMEIIVGGNYRMYMPNSRGTIFRDTAFQRDYSTDQFGNTVVDSTRIKIKNKEFGVYAGLEKKVLKEKLKINLTARLDKNENFKYLFSPALSAVYSFNAKQIIRASFSSAIRNPTLSDQYLYYRVSPLIFLVGNINGFDSLVTVPSLLTAMNYGNRDSLVYFNVKPIQPEEVKTIEVGYRATLFNNLYLDLVGYFSWYKNFIGYKIGATYTYEPAVNFILPQKIYRVAANSDDEVTTKGVSVGLSYFFKKFFTLNGNYSYNVLDRGGSVDPLIPAYNTPENKFNIGISGRDVDVYLFNTVRLRNFGFGINFKWVQGFNYEGSPQFTGYVPSYNTVDAQISYHLSKIYSTFKLGASNLLNNEKFTVYGGPTVGRLAYFSILVELNR